MELVMDTVIGIPPKAVTALLRLDGLAVATAAIVAFALAGGNWWLFALLILAPDLAFLAMGLGPKRTAMVYNVVHSYTWPVILIGAGLLTPVTWLLPVGLIWAAHIGIDRAVGYGLKYPDSIETTHLGLIGKARKAATRANAS
jgi:hypothetical protein